MKILLAVSGGIDSMYLANRAPELFKGAEFAIAHCNFSLRGEESDRDESFVRDWCSTHGFRLFVTRFETSAYAESHGISIEMAARELRYSWFREIMISEGFDALATAHNANDNAETLMLNLLRGTGTKGITGMSESAPFGYDGQLRLLRPLIDISRKEILKWMESHRCSWREDSSNAACDYKRNKIRNLVFPLFSEINPSFIQTLNADMKRFAQTDDIAEDYFISKKELVFQEGVIIVDELLALKFWKYVLWRLLEDYSFSGETFGKLCELLDRYKNNPRGSVTLAGKKFESPTAVLSARKPRCGRTGLYLVRID